jgi:hypothetical protein
MKRANHEAVKNTKRALSGEAAIASENHFLPRNTQAAEEIREIGQKKRLGRDLEG